MTKPDSALTLLAEYRSWTREQIVTVIAGVLDEDLRRPGLIPGGVGDGSIWDAFLHMIDVEESWLDRVKGLPDRGLPTPERFPDLDAGAAIWAEVSARWLAFAEGRGLVKPETPFQTRTHTVPSWVIGLHAFNHTTHHRAEMWSALTALGFQPPELDVLDFVRATSADTLEPSENASAS